MILRRLERWCVHLAPTVDANDVHALNAFRSFFFTNYFFRQEGLVFLIAVPLWKTETTTSKNVEPKSWEIRAWLLLLRFGKRPPPQAMLTKRETIFRMEHIMGESGFVRCWPKLFDQSKEKSCFRLRNVNSNPTVYRTEKSQRNSSRYCWIACLIGHSKTQS